MCRSGHGIKETPMNTDTLDSIDGLAAKVRSDFPLLDTEVDGHPLVYLDSAATSLTPRAVADEMMRYYLEISANVHRGKHFLSETASDDVEEARMAVAEMTGFRSNEVVFTANATASLNLVARGLPVRSEDLVLLPMDGHHSALLPWRDRCRVEYVPLAADGRADLERYAALLGEGPRVVVLNHCSNVTGIYSPVAEMARLARAAGTVTVLDAAQSVPHHRVLVPEVDFLAFSAHKMLGPTGLGVLCGRYDQLSRITPSVLGGGVVDWVDLERHDLRKLPHRLEAGTPHIAGIYGLHAAIRYLNAIGWSALADHDRALGRLLLDEAGKRSYLRIVAGSRAERGGIVSVAVSGNARLKSAAQILSDSYGVMCRTGHMCAQPLVDHYTDGEVLRMSAYLYTTSTDVRTVFAALDEVVQVAGSTR
jgi:cysteine desulfurase/selenocysteine lyase